MVALLPGPRAIAAPSADPSAPTPCLPERVPACIPAEAQRLAGTLTLRDGSVVGVRAIRDDDGARLRAFHALLSARTIHLRYFGMVPRLSPGQINRLVGVDYAGDMALVATQGAGADERIIAVVRYACCGPDTAEVAFVVEDAWQHRGIAAALFRLLVPYARAHGFTTLLAVTLPENLPMRALLRQAGYPLTVRYVDGTVELSLAIAGTTAAADGAPAPA